MTSKGTQPGKAKQAKPLAAVEAVYGPGASAHVRDLFAAGAFVFVAAKGKPATYRDGGWRAKAKGDYETKCTTPERLDHFLGRAGDQGSICIVPGTVGAVVLDVDGGGLARLAEHHPPADVVHHDAEADQGHLLHDHPHGAHAVPRSADADGALGNPNHVDAPDHDPAAPVVVDIRADRGYVVVHDGPDLEKWARFAQREKPPDDLRPPPAWAVERAAATAADGPAQGSTTTSPSGTRTWPERGKGLRGDPPDQPLTPAQQKKIADALQDFADAAKNSATGGRLAGLAKRIAGLTRWWGAVDGDADQAFDALESRLAGPHQLDQLHRGFAAGWADAREDVKPPRTAKPAVVGPPGTYRYTLDAFRTALAAFGVALVWDKRHCDVLARAGAGTPAAQDGAPTTWTKLDDRLEDRLRLRLGDRVAFQPHPKAKDQTPRPARYGADKWTELVNAHIAYRQRDAFEDYLAGLPPWDHVERLESLLTDAFGATGPLARWAGAAILVAAVKRTREPGSEQKETPVLFGPKNIGKSTLLAALFPAEHRTVWFADNVDPLSHERERTDNVEGRVLVELGELEAVQGRVAMARFRAWLSRRNDAIRKSYGRRRDERPRMFVTVATTNAREHVPNDPHGAFVRLVSIECPGQPRQGERTGGRSLVGDVEAWLDAPTGEDQDPLRDLLWAEAVHRVDHQGLDGRLPENLYPDLLAAAEEHRDADTALETRIETWLVGAESLPFDHLPGRIAAQATQQDAIVTFDAARLALHVGGRMTTPTADSERGPGEDPEFVPDAVVSKADARRLADALKAAGCKPLGRGNRKGVFNSYWLLPARRA